MKTLHGSARKAPSERLLVDRLAAGESRRPLGAVAAPPGRAPRSLPTLDGRTRGGRRGRAQHGHAEGVGGPAAPGGRARERSRLAPAPHLQRLHGLPPRASAARASRRRPGRAGRSLAGLGREPDLARGSAAATGAPLLGPPRDPRLAGPAQGARRNSLLPRDAPSRHRPAPEAQLGQRPQAASVRPRDPRPAPSGRGLGAGGVAPGLAANDRRRATGRGLPPRASAGASPRCSGTSIATHGDGRSGSSWRGSSRPSAIVKRPRRNTAAPATAGPRPCPRQDGRHSRERAPSSYWLDAGGRSASPPSRA